LGISGNVQSNVEKKFLKINNLIKRFITGLGAHCTNARLLPNLDKNKKPIPNGGEAGNVL
jgi:hypothetical protein